MMCSLGVLRATWLVILTSVSSTWSGVAPSSRAICVSVLILLGIRLSRPMRIGLMSWRTASASRITITPSAASVARAGRSSGIFMGIDCLVLRGQGYDRNYSRRRPYLLSHTMGRDSGYMKETFVVSLLIC